MAVVSRRRLPSESRVKRESRVGREIVTYRRSEEDGISLGEVFVP